MLQMYKTTPFQMLAWLTKESDNPLSSLIPTRFLPENYEEVGIDKSLCIMIEVKIEYDKTDLIDICHFLKTVKEYDNKYPAMLTVKWNKDEEFGDILNDDLADTSEKVKHDFSISRNVEKDFIAMNFVRRPNNE